MKLDIKTLKEAQTIEEYFDTYFNSSELGGELILLPQNSREFLDNLIQIPGDNYLITFRLNKDDYLSDCNLLLKIYLYIWLNPIYLELYFGLDKWWEPAVIELLGDKKVCSVWKIRSFKDSNILSFAFTVPKVMPVSRLDMFNVITEDIIKARLSAALQELHRI